MIIAIPSRIEKMAESYTFVFSVIPPIVSFQNSSEKEKDLLVKLKETYSIDEACKDQEKKFCYPAILGGIFIFNENVIVKRYETYGYICKGNEYSIANLNNLFEKMEKGEEWCFKFSDEEILCYKKNKISQECRWIDNIGLRFIMDTL